MVPVVQRPVGLCLRNDAVEGLCQLCNIRSHVREIVRADDSLGKNGSTGIYDAAFGGLTTNINADY